MYLFIWHSKLHFLRHLQLFPNAIAEIIYDKAVNDEGSSYEALVSLGYFRNENYTSHLLALESFIFVFVSNDY